MRHFSLLRLFVVFSFLFTNLFLYAFSDKNIIYIYKDEGVSTELFSQTVKAVNETLNNSYVVREINAQGVINNKWSDNAALFIIPGGADLPYVKKLNGMGNLNIKKYVKNGGSYLGLCAGAYYGSGYVEFDEGGELEVLGARELSFFPGKAIGPILAPYSYTSNSGSRAASVILEEVGDLKNTTLYYNGGGFFENAETYPNVSVLGYYKISSEKFPAIIYVNYAKGKVILSGVHFEFDALSFYTSDPYLKSILPDLKKTDAERRILLKEVFSKLGLKAEHF